MRSQPSQPAVTQSCLKSGKTGRGNGLKTHGTCSSDDAVVPTAGLCSSLPTSSQAQSLPRKTIRITRIIHYIFVALQISP